eukprot:10198154-Ditylum_brightwellii.AAC.1
MGTVRECCFPSWPKILWQRQMEADWSVNPDTVKTHAQMVMKRQEAGEDIFAELEDGDNWAPEVRTETTIFRDSVHTQQRQNKASSTGSQPISDAIDMTAAQIL